MPIPTKKVKVSPRLVKIRVYFDNFIREYYTFLLRIEESYDGLCIVFNTINTPGVMETTRQRKIHISKGIKFEALELTTEDISMENMSVIFSKGYYEDVEYTESHVVYKDERTGNSDAVQSQPAKSRPAAVPLQPPVDRMPQEQLEPPKYAGLDIDDLASAIQRDIKSAHIGNIKGRASLQTIADEEDFDPRSGSDED